MAQIAVVLCLIVCLTAAQRTHAQSEVDQTYNRIVALQTIADNYQALHVEAIAQGKAEFSWGFGVPPETTQAIIDETKKLEALANQGQVRAKHLYGTLKYSHGERFWHKRDRPDWEKDIVDQYFKDAEIWFRSASNDGYPRSMYMLAVMHANARLLLRPCRSFATAA